MNMSGMILKKKIWIFQLSMLLQHQSLIVVFLSYWQERTELKLMGLWKTRLVSGMKCLQEPRPCELPGMERLSALRQARAWQHDRVWH